MADAKKGSCPSCKGLALPHPDNAHAPFCSKRCKLVDLGNWLGETYRIPTDPLSGLLDEETHEG
jgi:endogenous inhibitor of DNA gyrase (YacG/DUF329 family)